MQSDSHNEQKPENVQYEIHPLLPETKASLDWLAGLHEFPCPKCGTLCLFKSGCQECTDVYVAELGPEEETNAHIIRSLIAKLAIHFRSLGPK